MPIRQKGQSGDIQQELFARKGTDYEYTDSIRPDGRETLAGVPAQDGRGTGSARQVAGDAVRGPGKDQRRDDGSPTAIDEAGIDAATGPRPGLGDGQGTLHSSPGRIPRTDGVVEPPRNQANYQITDADHLGEGSLKQKFRQNV